MLPRLHCCYATAVTFGSLGPSKPIMTGMRYLGLGVLSAAVLLLELTLTRIYSVTQGYHFAFLAVSLGLLGFGASGTVLFVAPGIWRKGRQRLLGLSALLFTLTTLAAYWAISLIPFDSYRLVLEPTMFLYLTLFYVAQVVPFFFAGLVLGGALSLEPRKAGGLYGASLVGSGAGALLALGGPASSGPVGALGVVATLGAIAWIALAAAPSARRLGLVGGVAAAVIAVGWLAPRMVEPDISPYKALPHLLRQQGATLVQTRWNAFSRIDVVTSDALHQAPGLSFAYTGTLPPQTAHTVDGDNMTVLTSVAPDDASFTEYLPTAVAYRLLARPRVLIVEPGGGLDVLSALHNGAARVVTLVSNPLEAELLREQFSDRSAESQVEVVAGNPRSYLARKGDRVDLVVLPLRDAFRPVTAGAYSLAETHIYTKEAFKAYFRRLSPQGMLMVTRWVQVPPSEEMRATATAIEAMEEMGIRDLEDKLAAIRTLQTFTLIAKKEGFTLDEVRIMRSFAASRQMDLSYLPGLEAAELNRFFVLPDEVYYSGIRSLLDPRQRPRYYEEQTFDIAPTTDERPFFFHFFRWRQAPEVLARLGKAWEPFGGAGFLVILLFLGIMLAVSTLLILAPLLLKRRSGRQENVPGAGARWATFTYFFLLGLAFLWIELPLMQRFILLLDHPTYSFGVVLFSVLVFSGLGSLLSPRMGRRRPWAILALGILTIVYAIGPVPPMSLVLGLPLAARMVIAILTIAPLALLMGVPFPSGIVALEARRSGLIPWAWGTNGYASVIGSVLAALIALSWGFSLVMLLAGAGYLLAWAVFYLALNAPPAEARTSPPLD